MSDKRILELIEKQDKYYVLGFINEIKANRDELLKENAELQNNWNELKEWLEIRMSVYEYPEASNYYEALNKMNELERGASDDKIN